MSSITLNDTRVYRTERDSKQNEGEKYNEYAVIARTIDDEGEKHHYARIKLVFSKKWKEANPDLFKQVEVCDKSFDFTKLEGFISAEKRQDKDGNTIVNPVIIITPVK